MLIISLLAIVSNAMGACGIFIGGTWVEPCNIFTILISPPGGGKTPANNKLFLEPLRNIEKTEKEDYNKKPVDENDVKVDPIGESILYHCKTRILTEVTHMVKGYILYVTLKQFQINVQTLILSLFYGNKNAIIIQDEYRVQYQSCYIIYNYLYEI